jgi:uncharacterized protein YdhG (YjbR/CyaY superfamily)
MSLSRTGAGTLTSHDDLGRERCSCPAPAPVHRHREIRYRWLVAEIDLPNIGAPATRALAQAGVNRLSDLASWTERDLLELHGVGPKAIKILTPVLAEHGLGFRSDEGLHKVEGYLAKVPSPQRQTLDTVRASLRKVLPDATEDLRYGMPTFLVGGKGVAAYASFKAHCGYFPMSSTVLVEAGDAVAKYEVSKGGLRFPVDKPLPITLIRKLVKIRLAEIAATGH